MEGLALLELLASVEFDHTPTRIEALDDGRAIVTTRAKEVAQVERDGIAWSTRLEVPLTEMAVGKDNLVVAGNDPDRLEFELYLLDLEGRVLSSVKHINLYNAVAADPGRGFRAVAVNNNSTIETFADGQPRAEFDLHDTNYQLSIWGGQVHKLSFHYSLMNQHVLRYNEEVLHAGTAGGQVLLLEAGLENPVLARVKGKIIGLEFGEEGFVVATREGAVDWFDGKGNNLRNLDTGRPIMDLAMTEDLVAVSNWDHLMVLQNGEIIADLEDDNLISGLAWADGGKTLWAGTNSGELRRYRLEL